MIGSGLGCVCVCECVVLSLLQKSWVLPLLSFFCPGGDECPFFFSLYFHGFYLKVKSVKKRVIIMDSVPPCWSVQGMIAGDLPAA